jgi:DNA-binding LacI/PurR family transcriptional regulator
MLSCKLQKELKSICIFTTIVHAACGILEQNLGKYNYYVVMPHFNPEDSPTECHAVLNLIPADQLVLLDKNVESLPTKCLRVFQDFNRDIFTALEGLYDLLDKYQRLVLITPDATNTFLAEISWGFRTFCIMHQVPYSLQISSEREALQPGSAYVVMDTHDLAELIREARQQCYELGQVVGLLSFNETPLKELLDITVITTDFEAMGRTAAELLLAKKQIAVKNPFYTIRRTSL